MRSVAWTGTIGSRLAWTVSHAHLTAATALAPAHKQRAAPLIEARFAQREGFVDA
jgi:hypothetical protein